MNRSILFLFKFLLMFVSIGTAKSALGQVKKMVVVDQETSLPLPFVIASIEEKGLEMLSDADGVITYDTTTIGNTAWIKKYGYLSVNQILGTKDTLKLARLRKVGGYVKKDEGAEELLQNIKFNKINDFLNRPFFYQAFNQHHLTSNELVRVEEQLQQKRSWLLSLFGSSNEFSNEVFTIETLTERSYLDEFHEEDVLLAQQTEGVQNAQALAMASHLQPMDLFQDFISLAGKEYISPLCTYSFKWYRYHIDHRIIMGIDTLYFLHFNPQNKRLEDVLAGEMIVDQKGTLIAFTLHPYHRKHMYKEFTQVYEVQEGRWFPKRYMLHLIVKRNGKVGLRFVSKGEILELDPTYSGTKSEFDEVAKDFSQPGNSLFAIPDSLSTINLFEKDNPTNATTQSWFRRKMDIDKLFVWGLNFYYRNLTIGPFSLDTRRLLYFNDVEGLRIGFGLYTSHNFSKHFRAGGWVGYGLRDERVKSGVEAAYEVLPEIRGWLGVGLEDDLIEQGGLHYQLDQYMYFAENLRKYRLSRLERTVTQSIRFSAFPYPYVGVALSGRSFFSDPLYSYAYGNEQDTAFRVVEVRATGRYRYGSKVTLLEDTRIEEPTEYPEVWIQASAGVLRGGLGAFRKLEGKIQQRIKVLGVGHLSWQLQGGLASGSLPFPVLYSPPGSYRTDFSFVTHNAFEIMGYNEFVVQRFLYLFLAHDFGALHLGSKWTAPRFIVMQNIGWGELDNQQTHQFVDTKDMALGYFESGLVVKEILMVPVGGPKIGFGSGFFFRYGAYGRNSFGRNSAVKLALSLKF